MRRLFLIMSICLCMVWLVSSPGNADMKKSSLVVATDTPPRMMDPQGADADANLSYMANFFDGLLQRDAKGKLKPALAVRYTHPDPLSWKFWLRKGVKFQNGDRFTAADVKFTFERMADPKISEFTNTAQTIASIDMIDDYTVVIKTKTPIPWFANNLHQIFIMDKKSTEASSEGDVLAHPNGTGAYKLVEWVKGSYLKLEANPRYWGGVPPIKHVEIRPITEASTRFAALVSGQVDLVSGVPVELFNQIKKNPKLEVITHASRRCIFLALGNKPGAPWADIRVRKAMYMAINEKAIIQKVMHGHAAFAAQIPDPPTVGYNPAIKRLAYNPREAKKLLKEAGYPHGFEISFHGPNDRYMQDAAIGQAVAEYLAKVGIKVKLDVKPKSIFFPEVNAGNLEFYLIGWFDGTYDMGRTYFKLAHSRDKEAGYGELNGASYSDPQIDKLLEATASIVDPAARKKALEHLNDVAMVDKIVWIPLHYQQNIYAIQRHKGIHFTPRPDRWMVYKEISIK
jgi:peptide/nickel transport system substrate-binding protein